MRNLFLALIAGLLFPLAFAPYGLWPLLLVSVALAYWVQASAPSAKAALLGGWVYGLGMFGFGVAWLQVSMTDYGYMPLWMAVPATAAFAAVHGNPARPLTSQRLRTCWIATRGPCAQS